MAAISEGSCVGNRTGSEMVLATDLCSCRRDDLSYKQVQMLQVDWKILDDDQQSSLRAYYSLLGILGLVVMLLNASVVAGVVRDQRLRIQTNNFLVAGQAFADFMVGFTFAFFNLGTLVNGGYLVGGQLGCMIYGFGIVIFCHATLFSLALIAYFRKCCILKSMSFPLRYMIKQYVIWVWGVTFLLAIFYVLSTTSRLTCSGSFCSPLWTESDILVCGLFIGIPIVYILYVYNRIQKHLAKSRAVFQKHVKPYSPEESRSHNRTSRLMTFIRCGTVAVWLPLYIYFLLSIASLSSRDRHEETSQRTLQRMAVFEKLLGVTCLVSSLTSPIIYAFKNKTLKVAMLYCCMPMAWKEERLERVRIEIQQKIDQRNASVISRSSFVSRFLNARNNQVKKVAHYPSTSSLVMICKAQQAKKLDNDDDDEEEEDPFEFYDNPLRFPEGEYSTNSKFQEACFPHDDVGVGIPDEFEVSSQFGDIGGGEEDDDDEEISSQFGDVEEVSSQFGDIDGVSSQFGDIGEEVEEEISSQFGDVDEVSSHFGIEDENSHQQESHRESGNEHEKKEEEEQKHQQVELEPFPFAQSESEESEPHITDFPFETAPNETELQAQETSDFLAIEIHDLEAQDSSDLISESKSQSSSETEYDEDDIL